MSMSTGAAVTAAVLNPQPERWGAMRSGNTDSRARDLTPDLETIGDTVSVATCSVVRRDGKPAGNQDLSWTGAVSYDSTRRIVTVMLAVGLNVPLLTPKNPIDYTVTITAQTNGGRILSWDGYQLVVAEIG